MLFELWEFVVFCRVALLCVCLFASLLVSTVTYVVGYLARLFCSLEIWLVVLFLALFCACC